MDTSHDFNNTRQDVEYNPEHTMSSYARYGIVERAKHKKFCKYSLSNYLHKTELHAKMKI